MLQNSGDFPEVVCHICMASKMTLNTEVWAAEYSPLSDSVTFLQMLNSVTSTSVPATVLRRYKIFCLNHCVFSILQKGEPPSTGASMSPVTTTEAMTGFNFTHPIVGVYTCPACSSSSCNQSVRYSCLQAPGDIRDTFEY